MTMTYTIPFSQISYTDVPSVGGKNASLGEMFNTLSVQGIHIPDGFATTAEGFQLFLERNKLVPPLKALMARLNTQTFANLSEIGGEARKLLTDAVLPDELSAAVVKSYAELCKPYGRELDVAVRSSATAEDLPNASFAGQHDTFLNRKGAEEVVAAIQLCFVSLFNNRAIKYHYQCPMDIEWAKDGNTGDMFIVQARPETVHSQKDPFVLHEFLLSELGTVIAQGSAVGSKIAAGIARILKSPADAGRLQAGEVLVTDSTNPDWDPILKKAAAIITNKGGRTSHAAIVARELGTAAVVGTLDATKKIKDGQWVTVSCAQGKTGLVYDGKLAWEEKEINFKGVQIPKTAPMLILGDPDKAFLYSFYPNRGIGLMRLEFIINNSIRIHPMALVKYDELPSDAVKKEIEAITAGYADKEQYFIDKLAQAVATIAAAFYGKDVIVRMSDFKSNEYANLIGGKDFEPDEENPMLGFRGASRYYHERYREGFRLECEAMKKVRGEMGLTNVKLMIPFCRTVEEGKKVVDLMAQYGLKRGDNGLEIYVMAEIPSNVILAKQFAEVFDGFSIGSNDLTQLTLGLDRDSAIVSELFDENNPAVKEMISRVIHDAHASGSKIGLCGQAPSDFPEFAAFLVENGIDSISFNPDALLKGMENMVAAEGN